MEVIISVYVCGFVILWIASLFKDSSPGDSKTRIGSDNPIISIASTKGGIKNIDVRVVKLVGDGLKAIVTDPDSKRYASVSRYETRFRVGEVIKVDIEKYNSYTWRDTVETYKVLTVTHAFRGAHGKYASIAVTGERCFRCTRKEDNRPYKVGEKLRISVNSYNNSVYYSKKDIESNEAKWTQEFDRYEVIIKLGLLEDKYWVVIKYRAKFTVLFNSVNIWTRDDSEYWMQKDALNAYNYFSLSKCKSICSNGVAKHQKINSANWERQEDIEYEKFLQTAILKGEKICYDLMRTFSIMALKRYDLSTRDEIFQSLNSGIAILSEGSQMNMYNNSYGTMHKNKLLEAYENIPKLDRSESLTIIDYGCGQGNGTMILINELSKNLGLEQLKNVILVEPSEAALTRAVITLDYYKKQESLDFNVVLYNKVLNDLMGTDILHVTDVCIHIFSNVIDIIDVDNDHLLESIAKANIFSSKEIFVCVGPKFTPTGDDFRSQKFRRFAYGLDGHVHAENFADIGKWTRQHIVVQK